MSAAGQASAIYEGSVRHRRLAPVEHSFRYPIFMVYLDLDELPQALDPLRGWSARRPALARFKRSDHLEPDDAPLDRVVRDEVEAETAARPTGPIRMLTNLRYFGHCFNPVSFFFCFDDAGERVEAVLAEVNNTPWGESHAYVIENTKPATSSASPAGVPLAAQPRVITGRMNKDFHVSPLMGMDHVYEWRTTIPGNDLQVHIASHSEGRLAFDATLSLERRELEPAVARRMLIRYPAITAQVVAKIYWQAALLRLKGAPYHPHPERSR